MEMVDSWESSEVEICVFGLSSCIIVIAFALLFAICANSGDKRICNFIVSVLKGSTKPSVN